MRTALVTGAGSGIGRATAETLAAAGWRVYATDIDADALETLENCLTETVDVTDADDIESLHSRIADEVSGLDCVVANAGVAQLGPLADIPSEQLQAQFDVNVHGAHRTIQEMLPLLAERDGTAIIVSSTHARITTPGMGAYAASKHAVEALAETLRMEVTDLSVDVAVIEPAWVTTAFADTSQQHLANTDHSDRFADVYDAMAEGTLIAGRGPLTVSPDRVAAKIHTVATTENPALRHPVGWPAKLLLSTRWLPQPVRSLGQRTVIKAFAALHRFRGQDR
ncbi:SDR family NAD(P)-dependent oxidoreductase [Halapricum salinum]|uniref:SDR family NAD(P)-dependent oxidoreductase n=1 Tax=Halapricum salinum TaxID=1457250 RepID=A0A4D6HBS9_9EURY|nr:SDR family NAD(P)-dependent oxidoreductase [Halapricum salinum]QCC51409.1 SDR family NAD(P)-dependent oxidoreductase [Halapricum salinum]